MDMGATGRFNAEAMTAAMRQVADKLGVPADDARLLRMTNNAVFALPDIGIVIRVARTHRLRHRVGTAVELAKWFAQVDAPTIRLAPDIAQPVEIGELRASVWRYLAPAPPAPAADNLGRVLREFHTLGAPPFPVPQWDPVGDARRRLADAEELQEADRVFLWEWCGALDARIAALRQREPERLIHGDAHVGNLLRGPDGRVVLCDFDATCLGPWQVDLVAVAVGEARFGRAGAHAALASAYGYDVTTDPNWPLLREARELKMVVAAVPLLESSPRYAAEFANRLRSVRCGDHEAGWIPFADLAQTANSATVP
ncbi:aminoglycoside phosphotransferase family protein [Micromonospora sp. NPDC048063]|uniref:aminoglycoside phosphotransferase family protein n=1 Tax=Micromonospora sp. NPDC048063 TaxID=3364256 RepID=UPI00371DA377